MSGRSLLALVLLPLLVVAAPVPKRKPAFGPFGGFTDPNTKCKGEYSKDGTLTITVPTTQPAVDPHQMKPLPPLMGKTVEGDFVATVRLTQSLPEGAKTALTERSRVSVMAGMSVFAEGSAELGAMITMERVCSHGEWATLDLWAERGEKSGGWCQSGTGVEGNTPVYLRLTRKGEKVVVEQSEDGKKWWHVFGQKLDGLTGAVTVGPVAFQCTDKEFTATFDEYDITPLEK